MEINLLLGYAGAVLTGLILGLLGGGAALLSIPVLVYFFHLEASVATSYSLFLIGIAASSGALQNIRKKTIDYQAALYYGIPSILTVYVLRRFVIHRLPDVIFSTPAFSLSKDQLILFFLSMVMFGVAYKMIKTANVAEETGTGKTYHAILIIYAIMVGCFIGLVGAGGGFLMTPALIFLAGLDMKKAIGTSLLLVAVNSFVGFLGDIHSSLNLDWNFLFIFSIFSVSGVFAGTYLTSWIDSQKLKKSFGWFVLFLAIYIVVREAIHLASQ
jgi:uncharacterized protein